MAPLASTTEDLPRIVFATTSIYHFLCEAAAEPAPEEPASAAT